METIKRQIAKMLGISEDKFNIKIPTVAKDIIWINVINGHDYYAFLTKTGKVKKNSIRYNF